MYRWDIHSVCVCVCLLAVTRQYLSKSMFVERLIDWWQICSTKFIVRSFVLFLSLAGRSIRDQVDLSNERENLCVCVCVSLSHLWDIKVDNSRSNQVERVRVRISRSTTYMQSFSVVSSIRNSCILSMSHTDVVMPVKWQQKEKKVNGGGRSDVPCCSCSIEHLVMMSETVALLLWRVERRSILWYIDIHTSERRLSNNIFSLSLLLALLLTSYACSSGDVVDFRFIESIWTLNDRCLCLSCNIHILICWIVRQMCREERERERRTDEDEWEECKHQHLASVVSLVSNAFVMYFGFATLVLIWKNDSICISKLCEWSIMYFSRQRMCAGGMSLVMRMYFTLGLCRSMHSLCMCVFCSSSSLDNFYF